MIWGGKQEGSKAREETGEREREQRGRENRKPETKGLMFRKTLEHSAQGTELQFLYFVKAIREELP